jgi:hypothetical protein
MRKVFISLIFISSFSVSVSGQQKKLSESALAARIDAHISKNLQKVKLTKGKPINDETFLRKIYLDIVGRIPTLEEARHFLNSRDSKKREKLIDGLQRSPGYVSHNFNYWADALRILDRQAGITKSYSTFLKSSLIKNTPYDVFVRQMLNAKGSLYDYKNGAVNYYMRDKGMPLDNLSNTMSLFLGTDMSCAQCHDHPFDRWTQKDFYQLAAFMDGIKTGGRDNEAQAAYRSYLSKEKDKQKTILSRFMLFTKEEVNHMGSGLIQLPSDYSYDDHKPFEFVRADVPFGPKVSLRKQQPFPKTTPKGKPTKKLADINSRTVFAQWLTSKENPMFTKTIVNRMWDKTMGAPLIGDSLLSIGLKSLGTNKDLTTELIKQLQYLNFDLKKFEKVLFLTKLYQTKSRSTDINYAQKEKNYNQDPILRRLSAEQIWDSYQVLKLGNIDKTLDFSIKLDSYQYFYEMHKNKSAQQIIKLIPNKVPLWRNYFKDLEGAAAKYSQKLSGKSQKAEPSANTDKKKRRKGGKGIRVLRSPRASELAQPMRPGSPLRELGQSSRELIDSKSLESSAPQAMLLMNNIVGSITNSRNTQLMRDINSGKSSTEKITNAFLAILTRKPTSIEIKDFSALLSKNKQEGVRHMAWILMNSNEFKFKH